MARLILAEAQSVTTAGLDGDAIASGASGSQVGGAPQLAKGVIYINITKTAGGAINPATETLKVMCKPPGSSTWCDVYQSHEDTDPVNFFAGASGASEMNRAFPITVFGAMKVVIDGDGSDDTYTIDEDIVIETF